MYIALEFVPKKHYMNDSFDTALSFSASRNLVHLLAAVCTWLTTQITETHIELLKADCM